MWDRRLQRVETIVEWQQCMLTECDDDRLILDRKHRGLRLFRAAWQIGNSFPLLPLGDGLLIDPVALGESPQARFTLLYRSLGSLCRCGALV